MVTLEEMELESGGDDGLRMGEGVKCVRRPSPLPPGPSQPPWPAWRGEYYEGKCDRRCPSPTSHASGNNPAYKVSTRATPQENSRETVKKVPLREQNIKRQVKSQNLQASLVEKFFYHISIFPSSLKPELG